MSEEYENSSSDSSSTTISDTEDNFNELQDLCDDFAVLLILTQ